jgi:hypothetical protein
MKEKMKINVLIENDQLFAEDYNANQKLNVIVNKTTNHFNLSDSDKRVLRREDGTELLDYKQTIKDVGIVNDETLRFFIKVDKPDRDKRFAI